MRKVSLCKCVDHLPDRIGFIIAFHSLFFRYSLPAKAQHPVKVPTSMCAGQHHWLNELQIVLVDDSNAWAHNCGRFLN